MVSDVWSSDSFNCARWEGNSAQASFLIVSVGWPFFQLSYRADGLGWDDAPLALGLLRLANLGRSVPGRGMKVDLWRGSDEADSLRE